MAEAWAEAKGAHSLIAVRSILSAGLLVEPAGAHMRFRPVVDGWFLPACPATAIDRGKQNDAPILTGMTANDIGTSWELRAPTSDNFRKETESRFGLSRRYAGKQCFGIECCLHRKKAKEL